MATEKMNQMKFVTQDGNTYDFNVVDQEARDLAQQALDAASASGGSGSGPIPYIESLDESNLANLRALDTGTYVLYGYFYPYPGAADTLTCDNTLVSVKKLSAGSHVLVFNPLNCKVNFVEILVDDTADSGFTYSVQLIDMRDLNTLIAMAGSLDELTTTEKGSIVGAINEVAQIDAVRYGEQTLSGAQKAQARTNIGAVTQADIDAAVSNVMPEFVDSVDQMTEQGKKYVLSSTGTIWVYGETHYEAPNLYDPATATLNMRLDSSMAETTLNGKLLLPLVDFDMTNPCYLRVKGITPVYNYDSFLNVVYVNDAGTKLAGKAFSTYGTDNGDYVYDLYNASAAGATKMRAWISVTASAAITADDLTGVSITLDNQEYTETGFYDTGMAWSVGANDTSDLKVQLNKVSESVEALEAEHTSLRGKKIVYDGDSIFAYSYHANPIAQITGSTFENQAVSSAWISATTEKHSVVNNLANLPTDGDLYCFEGGINDFWNDVPIGEVTSSYTGTVDNSTLCGALETIFRYAQENFVGKPVCFVIVHKISYTATSPNSNGDTFTDYHDAMVKVCEKYSIPYYDAFKRSGLNVLINAQKEAYCTDLVHPNEDGHKRYYVPQLIALFREIMPCI